MNDRRPLVAVIGAARCTREMAGKAEEVGRLLAQAGVDIVCGGRGGVMQAVCKGAFEAGGRTIGILPGDTDVEANDRLTVVIPSGLGEARNAIIAKAGEAVIAVGGSYGTLSEIAFALKNGKIVIGLDTWEARDGEGAAAAIKKAATPGEAVSMVLREIDQSRKRYDKR